MLSSPRNNCLSTIFGSPKIRKQSASPPQMLFPLSGNPFSCPDRDQTPVYHLNFSLYFTSADLSICYTSFLGIVRVHLIFTLPRYSLQENLLESSSRTCPPLHCDWWEQVPCLTKCAGCLPLYLSPFLSSPCSALYCMRLEDCRLHFPDSYNLQFLLGSATKRQKEGEDTLS